MAGTSLTYWLWWAGSVGVGVLLLGIGLWALYAGRVRGKVCPRCQFDLTNIEEPLCPECGEDTSRARKIRGKPRHPRIAIACFLLLNAVVALGVYRQMLSSWGEMLPDRVLIALLPMANSPDNSIWRETHRRIVAHEFSLDDQRALIERCLKGDSGAKPLDAQWRESYGWLLRRWRDSRPPVELLHLLYRVPVALELVTRDVWPRDVRVCVQVRVEDWWPPGTEIRLTAQPNMPGAEAETFIRTGYYMPVSRFALFLPSPAEGSHTVDYAVTVERRSISGTEKWEHVGIEHRAVSFDVAGVMDEVLPPAEEPVLDEMIAKLFSVGIARWESGISPVRVYFEPERTFVKEFAGVAVGAAVRVLHDGKVVRSMNLWWLGGPQNASPYEWNLGWEVPWEDVEAMLAAPGDDELWSVQVVSLPEVALRVPGAKRYWDGAVTVPTQVIEREGEAPPVPWRRASKD